MAGMISLTRISRLALAAALLLPTAAHASELTPEQMAWYRAQMGLAAQSGTPPSTNSVGDAVLEWRRLTATNAASFDQLSRFLMANRDWPDADKLRVRAEKAIALDSYDPQRTLAFVYHNVYKLIKVCALVRFLGNGFRHHARNGEHGAFLGLHNGLIRGLGACHKRGGKVFRRHFFFA